MIRRLFKRVGVDDTIFFGAGRLMVTTLSSLAMLVIVAHSLSREAQGYFYTFYSVFQIQAVVQAGAYLALYAAISHTWGHLSLGPDGKVQGPQEHLERLGGLLRLSVWWARLCALAFVLVLGPGGYLFFHVKGDHGVDWIGPWWVLAVSTAGSFLIMPPGLALESTGHTGAQQKAMFYGVLVSTLAGFAVLLGGGGLYAVGVMTIVRIAVTAVLFRRPVQQFAGLPTARLDWRDEILPQQARLTITWVLGFVVFLAAAPITFQAAGPVVAGRIGVAVQIYQAVNSIAGVWLTRSQPRMGVLAGQGRMGELHQRVIAISTRCTLVGVALTCGVLVLVLGLDRWVPALAARLPSLPVILIYAMVATLNQTPGAMTTAVRLTRIEPFIPVTAAGTVATLVSYSLLAHRFGELGIAAGFFGVTVLLVFPWSAAIYWRRIVGDHRASALTPSEVA